MIRFICTNCQSMLSVDEKHQGRKAACPRCGIPTQVPTLPPKARFDFSTPESTLDKPPRIRPLVKVWPTLLASACVLSVLWIGLFGTLSGYVAGKETGQGYGLYQSSSTLDLINGILIVSLVFSFILNITSLCLWSYHPIPGRVLTIVALVLLLPSLCCGMVLGVMTNRSRSDSYGGIQQDIPSLPQQNRVKGR